MTAFPLVTRPTALQASRCLNARHSEADCSRCTAACPTQSITVTDTTVTVNLEDCLGCGLCLHICPAEVFETSLWTERIPLNNVGELQTAVVDFFCGCHPHPDTGIPEIGSMQIPTCLVALSAGAWFELGLKQTIRVRLDSCEDCPLAGTTSAILQSVDTANDWLQNAGYDPGIVCMTREDDTRTPVKRPVVSGKHMRMSRRGFFESLFGAAKRERGSTLDDTVIESIGQKSPKKAPNLPAWMARAAQVYAHNARETATSCTVWPAIRIDANCAACNACTDHCPTGALNIRVTENTYTISFCAGCCVDCRICWASCPVGAITRSQQPAQTPFECQPVLQREVTGCVHCGRPATTEDHVCYWCAAEPPLKSILTDARQWLFSAPSSQSPDHLT